MRLLLLFYTRPVSLVSPAGRVCNLQMCRWLCIRKRDLYIIFIELRRYRLVLSLASRGSFMPLTVGSLLADIPCGGYSLRVVSLKLVYAMNRPSQINLLRSERHVACWIPVLIATSLIHYIHLVIRYHYCPNPTRPQTKPNAARFRFNIHQPRG